MSLINQHGGDVVSAGLAFFISKIEDDLTCEQFSIGWRQNKIVYHTSWCSSPDLRDFNAKESL
jgi:hypothetical protein